MKGKRLHEREIEGKIKENEKIEVSMIKRILRF